MKHALAALAGAAATLVVVTLLSEPKTIYETEVIERVHVEEVLTTIDLEELKDSIKELDEQLYEECLFVIHQHTGDPLEGLRHYVDRHYDGNACRAADEAARGEW
jgi:serine/threonine protein kinase HipA of HipAB toxin-antitoxin module